MNQAPRKRLSTWKIVGIVATVVVAVFLVAVFWVRSVTERRWTLYQAEMKARADKERTRDCSRPPLRGTAEPGNAWDDYALAIAEMKKLQGRDKLGALVDRTPKADPAWGETAVAQSGVILEPLRRGASKSTVRRGYDWEQGTMMATTGLLESQQVVSLAILNARSLLDAGKPREAVARLLDAAQFSRDMTDDGPMISEMIGTALLHVFLDAARELADSEKADAESLSDLEQGLAVLDGSFPKHSDSVRRELLAMGMTFAQVGHGTGVVEYDWGFAAKLFQLNLFERLQAAQEQVALASDLSWAESVATGRRVDAELQKSWNPVTRMFKPGQQSSERYVRERLAQLRLLRVAIRYRRTGELLDLDDPFGAKLRSAKNSDGMKLWSIGADGFDNGGSGGWKASAGPDIILEARRK
jgi:hypothetical protein